MQAYIPSKCVDVLKVGSPTTNVTKFILKGYVSDYKSCLLKLELLPLMISCFYVPTHLISSTLYNLVIPSSPDHHLLINYNMLILLATSYVPSILIVYILVEYGTAFSQ